MIKHRSTLSSKHRWPPDVLNTACLAQLLLLFNLLNAFSVNNGWKYRTKRKKTHDEQSREGQEEEDREKERDEVRGEGKRRKEVKRSRVAAGRCQESQRTICPSSAISTNTHTHTHATLNFLPQQHASTELLTFMSLHFSFYLVSNSRLFTVFFLLTYCLPSNSSVLYYFYL